MLEADKQALRGVLAQQVVALQAKELAYLHASFLSLATTSALLVGFGFTGLALFREDDLDTSFAIMQCLNTTLGFDYTRQPAHLSRPPSNSECARHMIGELIDNMWALSCGLGLSNNLVALFISTVTVITGPGMALRGPEGSLGVAIVNMERQQRRSLKHFGRGLFAFSCTIALFGLRAIAHLAPLKFVVLMSVGLHTIYMLHANGTDVARKFFIAVSRAERAEFTPADELVAAQASADEIALEIENRKKHGIGWTTPLLRLDKLVLLPYDSIYNKAGGRGRSQEEAQQSSRKQVSSLIQSAQGAVSVPDDTDDSPIGWLLLHDLRQRKRRSRKSAHKPSRTSSGASSSSNGLSRSTSTLAHAHTLTSPPLSVHLEVDESKMSDSELDECETASGFSSAWSCGGHPRSAASAAGCDHTTTQSELPMSAHQWLFQGFTSPFPAWPFFGAARKPSATDVATHSLPEQGEPAHARQSTASRGSLRQV
mmetsp:Transcript_40279/g.84482  ORF Transcript_40279/g.84482 Transcript_40279/m.84482 type:complete len:484 (-) Transcript_40279:262-1713(-)